MPHPDRLGGLFALALLAGVVAGCAAPPASPTCADPRPPLVCDTFQPPPAVSYPLDALTFERVEGTVLAAPVVGGEALFTHTVPEGAGWLAATVKWQTRGLALRLEATSPGGQAGAGEQRTLAGSSPRAPARLDWWARDPAPGLWTFRVTGDAAAQEPVAIQFHTLDVASGPSGMHVAEQTNVTPGRFVEVNMNMTQGQTMFYNWTTGQTVAFNVHTHRNGQTIDLVLQNGTALSGAFTADRDDVFSLLWEAPAETSGPAPPAPLPVAPPAVPALPGQPAAQGLALAYRADGAFELHSGAG